MQLFITVLACVLAAANAESSVCCSYGDSRVVMAQWDAVFTASNGGKVTTGYALFSRFVTLLSSRHELELTSRNNTNITALFPVC